MESCVCCVKKSKRKNMCKPKWTRKCAAHTFLVFFRVVEVERCGQTLLRAETELVCQYNFPWLCSLVSEALN